jgi:sodium ion-translocating decarboxylase beta subunit
MSFDFLSSLLVVGSLKEYIMVGIGLLLLWLAIKKDYEPLLLLPIGAGCLMANFPGSNAVGEGGFLTQLFNAGIETELFPILIFIGIGAMIDFAVMLKQPVTLFFGGPPVLGIFGAMLLALAVNFIRPGTFSVGEAASIGIIGAADGPTSIYVGKLFAKNWLGAIAVAAYSYMSLVPIIQPPVIRLLTSSRERKIRMEADYHAQVSKTLLILFPVMIIVLTGLILPKGMVLVGPLMLGNLLRVSGCVDRLSKSAQNELSNVVTLFLGLAVGSTMRAETFLRPETFLILAFGLLAFVFDTAAGVLFAKFLNLFLRHKLNPMIGAAGLSAFPMSARVVQKMAQQEDPTNILLMPAVGANVAGQIGSIVAGCLIISLLS